MLKQDLKDLMVVRLRNQDIGIIVGNTILCQDYKLDLDEYTETMIRERGPKNLDIAEVFVREGRSERDFSAGATALYRLEFCVKIWSSAAERNNLLIEDIHILKGLVALGYKYVTRDKSGMIKVHTSKPKVYATSGTYEIYPYKEQHTTDEMPRLNDKLRSIKFSKNEADIVTIIEMLRGVVRL